MEHIMEVSLHQIIHYYLYHSSTIVQSYVIEHNTNVLMNCLQKYQGTGFNSVGSVWDSKFAILIEELNIWKFIHKSFMPEKVDFIKS